MRERDMSGSAYCADCQARAAYPQGDRTRPLVITHLDTCPNKSGEVVSEPIFCFDEPDHTKPKFDWSNGYRHFVGYENHQVGHVGPHKIPLGMSAGFYQGPVVDADHDGHWVLEQTILLLEYREDDEPEVAADIALVTPLLTRPGMEPDPMYVEVTLEEIAALKRLLIESAEYWSMCDYAHTEGSDDDILLGVLADSGHVRAYSHCHNPDRKFIEEKP